LFPLPLALQVWPDAARYNPAIRSSILALEAQSQGESHSNVGGWHSPRGQLEFLGEPGEKLIEFVYAVVAEATRRVIEECGGHATALDFSLSGWANVSRNGAFNGVHTHPGSTWSAVYYVDAGAPTSPHHSQLQLLAPDQGRQNTFLSPLLPDTFCINPSVGLVVLFPSYVGHAVLPHQGTGTRISIAMNLRREPFP
jgi:uncharacterized protein (TIGR02466 family)